MNLHDLVQITHTGGAERAVRLASTCEDRTSKDLLKDRTIVLITPDKDFRNTTKGFSQEITISIRHSCIPL